MKKITSLILAVVCIALMIGGWAWLIGISSEPGSMVIALVPPMILTTIGLFIAAMILIGKFFKTLKTDCYLKTQAIEPPDEMNAPKELPVRKNYKALAGMVVQIAAIIALVIWLICNPIGIIFSLPAFAVFTGLIQGASLCEKLFRGEPIGDAPPPEKPQNPVPNPIDEPPPQFNAENNYIAACGTKNYRALVGVILRGAAIIGMWIYFAWLDSQTTGMGTLGLVALFPIALAFSAVLFIGAVLRISDYRLSGIWASGYATESTPQVKSRRNPVSIAVQSVLIFVAMAVLYGLIGFYPNVAIIVVFVILKLVDK